jgi:hypothetical protein
MYELENTATPKDLINCARFYNHINDNEKYEEIIEKLGEAQFPEGEDLIVKGWRNCYSSDENTIVRD